VKDAVGADACCSGVGEATALAVVKALLMAAPTTEDGRPEEREDDDWCRELDDSPVTGDSSVGEVVTAGETSRFEEALVIGLSVKVGPAPGVVVVESAAPSASLFFLSSSSRCLRCCSSCSRSDKRIASIIMS
jgi:hypothetical protein